MPSMPKGQRFYNDPTLIQVLSLYLLLLAFFVILFNISKVEQFKTTVVADSLNATFASRGQNTETPEQLASSLGTIVSDPAVQRRIGELIAAEFPIAEIRELKPGRILEARIPLSSLFQGDDVADDRRRFTESLAEVLASAPFGLRYEVDFLAGFAADTETDAGRDTRALSMARAGNLAARLVGAGAPPGHVAAGVEQGDPNWGRLLFYARGGATSPTIEPGPEVESGSAP